MQQKKQHASLPMLSSWRMKHKQGKENKTMLKTHLFGMLYFVQCNTLVDFCELIDIINDEIAPELTLKVWKTFYNLKAAVTQ